MEKENSENQTANNDKGDVNESSLPVIYGILEAPIRFGVQAYAIDGQTGEVIDQHFCSSESFAKSDLGFTDPIMLKWDSFSKETHSTVHFNSERKKKYMERYPNGYTMLWVGFWQNNSDVVRLREEKKFKIKALGGLIKPTIKNMSGNVKFEGTQEEWDALVKKNRIITIAMACHEANRVWCMSEGDYSQKHWNEAEEWQRDSAIKGVEFRLNNPGAKHDAQHNAWMADKVNDGWVYGVTKDAEKKIHPCIVPFEQLPLFQQKKDALFCAIVDALK